jgi:hypothetical protein
MRCGWQRFPRQSSALIVSLVALATKPAFAAEGENSDADRETFAITTSLVTPFFGAYLLEGKVRASSAVGIILSASYLSLDDDDWKVRAGTVGAGLDYYFGNDALRGWYVEGVVEAWLTSWRHGPSQQVAPVGVGYAAVALVGYEFVWELGPVLDLGVGATAFHVPSARVTVDRTELASEAITRVYPAVKVAVGWAF